MTILGRCALGRREGRVASTQRKQKGGPVQSSRAPVPMLCGVLRRLRSRPSKCGEAEQGSHVQQSRPAGDVVEGVNVDDVPSSKRSMVAVPFVGANSASASSTMRMLTNEGYRTDGQLQPGGFFLYEKKEEEALLNKPLPLVPSMDTHGTYDWVSKVHSAHDLRQVQKDGWVVRGAASDNFVWLCRPKVAGAGN